MNYWNPIISICDKLTMLLKCWTVSYELREILLRENCMDCHGIKNDFIALALVKL